MYKQNEVFETQWRYLKLVILLVFIVCPFHVPLNFSLPMVFQIGQDLDEDPRLRLMKKEWFEGKACLDIGCNNGLITIHIGICIVFLSLFFI